MIIDDDKQILEGFDRIANFHDVCVKSVTRWYNYQVPEIYKEALEQKLTETTVHIYSFFMQCDPGEGVYKYKKYNVMSIVVEFKDLNDAIEKVYTRLITNYTAQIEKGQLILQYTHDI